MTDTENNPRSNWFVGENYGRNKDQPPRFLSEGIWEHGYDDKYTDSVRSMQPGDRIAIHSWSTRQHDLPFDNRSKAVSVMAIKAIGTITENFNDGKRVCVDWTKQDPPREWYFHTHRRTVWRVQSGEWTRDGLLAFSFEGKPQDIDRFRNEFLTHGENEMDAEQKTENEKTRPSVTMPSATNLILYGPPGTGKTYAGTAAESGPASIRS